MPYVHCSRCHHEWEVCLSEKDSPCDWCDSPAGRILEKETSFEKFIIDLVNGRSHYDITGGSSFQLPDGWKIV